MLMWESNLAWIWKILIGIVLAGISVEDYKKRSVSLLKIMLMVFIGIAGILIFDCYTIPMGILGLLPGLSIIGISYVSRGKIGLGDGLVLCALGFFVGINHVFIMLISALFIAAFFSAGMLLCKRFAWKSEMPFIPFILMGYIGAVLC